MKEAIYKLHFDCGRQGDLRGVFVAEIGQVNQLIKSGKEVYFGEVLGKHSEISGPIEKCDITLVTEDQKAIQIFKQYDLETGYNPFNFMDEDEE